MVYHIINNLFLKHIEVKELTIEENNLRVFYNPFVVFARKPLVDGLFYPHKDFINIMSNKSKRVIYRSPKLEESSIQIVGDYICNFKTNRGSIIFKPRKKEIEYNFQFLSEYEVPIHSELYIPTWLGIKYYIYIPKDIEFDDLILQSDIARNLPFEYDHILSGTIKTKYSELINVRYPIKKQNFCAMI